MIDYNVSFPIINKKPSINFYCLRDCWGKYYFSFGDLICYDGLADGRIPVHILCDNFDKKPERGKHIKYLDIGTDKLERNLFLNKIDML